MSLPAPEAIMDRAIELAASVRHSTSPNPWVGAVLITPSGESFEGATQPPGGPHAERIALAGAGSAARGATLYTTLEPCSHQGRTGPCTDAIIGAGVARVVAAIGDPDPLVAGSGLRALREAEIDVTVGLRREEVTEQLAPYIHHRLTGRPWVVVKSAVSVDGRIGAPDGSSRWITSAEARADVHRMRAESDAIVVGAGTVRADDPELTVRDWVPVSGPAPADPLRVVIGTDIPDGARVRPCLAWPGPLPDLLDELGERGVVQLMVEGGSRVITAFRNADLVNRYVVYVAPVLFGGDDAVPLFAGRGAPTIADVERGRFVSVTGIGPDLRIEIEFDRGRR